MKGWSELRFFVCGGVFFVCLFVFTSVCSLQESSVLKYYEIQNISPKLVHYIFCWVVFLLACHFLLLYFLSVIS